MVIYLLHFHQPISERHTTQHYLGWCSEEGLDDRLWEHRKGKGARLTAVARERGIRFTLAECFPGDRATERKLKRRKNHKKFCPICNRHN